MAVRARLSPPRKEPIAWPWHTAKFLTLPASVLFGGERRLEADNYLSGGYGARLALNKRLGAASVLGSVANIWQPSRLKGTVVSPAFGTPFLAATQVFDLRPAARKFLSLDKTDNANERFVDAGQILVTCSGSVGRATLATAAIRQTLISHDLLRVTALSSSHAGWIYAYLRAPLVRSMMTSAQYGHIIKHLEPAHLAALPMPRPSDRLLSDCAAKVAAIVDARNCAFEYAQEAEKLFETAVRWPAKLSEPDHSFAVPASQAFSGRRRLEAAFHSPRVRQIYSHFQAAGLQTSSLQGLGVRAWLPGRFARIPASDGVSLLGSADLFELNADVKKKIADIDFGDELNGRVRAGWLLLARSGQTYGLLGTLAVANAFHEGKVISDDAIRIAPGPDCEIPMGYLYAALSHPQIGRPLMKALAYGSSIPHIDVADVLSLGVVRLSRQIESEISALIERSASLYARADILENELGEDIDLRLEKLLDGIWGEFLEFES